MTAHDYDLLGLHHFDRAEFRWAADAWHKALELEPTADRFFHVAGALNDAEDPEAALVVADRGLAAFPDAVKLTLARSRALHLLGRNDESLAAAEAGLAVEPHNLALINMKGLTLTTLGRPHEAIPYLDRFLSSQHPKPCSHVTLSTSINTVTD